MTPQPLAYPHRDALKVRASTSMPRLNDRQRAAIRARLTLRTADAVTPLTSIQDGRRSLTSENSSVNTLV